MHTTLTTKLRPSPPHILSIAQSFMILMRISDIAWVISHVKKKQKEKQKTNSFFPPDRWRFN